MAATTVRRRLTEVERAERVEALAAELAAAVEALTDSAGWQSMLEAGLPKIMSTRGSESGA
jgi:hypothetical protein